MDRTYRNKCTICNSGLPVGHKKTESGNSSKISVSRKPAIFYLETDKEPKYDYYSVRIKKVVIHNILRKQIYQDKYYLINSNFPFHYFDSFSILLDEDIPIKSIEKEEICNDFIPEIFVGANSIVYIYSYNSLKTLYSNHTIYQQDFKRISRRCRNSYFSVNNNSFFRNLREDDTSCDNCCIFL